MRCTDQRRARRLRRALLLALPLLAAMRGVRAQAAGVAALPPPGRPASIEALQLQFARRLVAAHPDTTFMTPAPARLLAIPVLEVELNGDGSVRRIGVLRHPTTGDEATELAIAAVRRAAPYGDVSHLPEPWLLVEMFLFDDEMRFKPATLDAD